MSVSYLTVRTAQGDAIFEVGGMAPPEVHARLSRVLQGLRRSETPPAPLAIERGEPIAPAPVPAPASSVVIAPPTTVDLEPQIAPEIAPPTPIDIDPERTEAPLEVLVIDGLWKLARLQELGMLSETEVGLLRARLLARVTEQPGPSSGLDQGPLLHV